MTNTLMAKKLKEFDQKFIPIYPHSAFDAIPGKTASMMTVKSFLESALEETIKEDRLSLAEKIRGMQSDFKKLEDEGLETGWYETVSFDSRQVIKALDEVLKLIEE